MYVTLLCVLYRCNPKNVKAKGEMIMEKNQKKVTYELNDRPPVGPGLALGLQHVMTMFSGNVAVSLIICGALGMDLKTTAFMLQCSMFAAGITTIVQSWGIGPVGAKLPIMMGSSFTFLGASISIGMDPDLGLSALFGAFLIGGVLEAVVGPVLIKLFKRYFTPIVTGSVVLAIGLSLLGIGLQYAAGGDGAADYGSLMNLGIAFFTLIVAVLLNHFGKGFLKAASIFIAMIIGFALAVLLGFVDFSSVGEAAWFAVPTPFKFGITFKAGAIVPVLFLFLVSMLEFIGDTTGVAINAADRPATNTELTSGIICDGLGSSFSAVFNCTPNVSFSQNTGLIGLTGVKSRYVVTFGGIILAVLSFVPKISQVIALMPSAVLGGVSIIMFGMIAISGLKVILLQKLTGRNSLIISVALGVGMGINMQPDAVAALPSILQTLLSGVAGTALIALLLNIILPNKPEDALAAEQSKDE